MRFMLLGIFLAVTSVWCLLLGWGSDSAFLPILGSLALPLLAALCVIRGFLDLRKLEQPEQ